MTTKKLDKKHNHQHNTPPTQYTANRQHNTEGTNEHYKKPGPRQSTLSHETT